MGQELKVVGSQPNQSIEQGFQEGGILRQHPLLDIDPSDQFADPGQGRVMQGKIPNQNLKSDQLTLMGKLAHCHVKGQFSLIEVREFPGEEVMDIAPSPGRPTVVTTSRRRFLTKAVLLATGASHRCRSSSQLMTRTS